MRRSLVLLVGALLFTSGCVVLDPQRRDERKEHRHQLRSQIVEYAKPGPIVWGGANPIPNTTPAGKFYPFPIIGVWAALGFPH
jgi:hypothetical protein